MTNQTETLYIKKGRRYYPWGNQSFANDVMKVGTFRLTYCPENGHYRYTQNVTPDTATFLAAASVAQWAMEQAILERAKSKPQPAPVPWTEKQLKLIEQFRSDMAATGALIPNYWMDSTAYEIAYAGIKAVEEIAKAIQFNKQ